MQTRKHTRTYAYTHTSPFPASSSFPAPPSVLVTAIRPGHRLSSLSPPVVHVTAIRPSCVAHTAVCSVAMLPCLLFVDACSTDDPVPAPPTWPSAWNCTCTAPMTDGLKLPGCALRCHIRRRGRTCVHAQRCGRTCFPSTARSISRREKKGECVEGLFFLSGFAPLAGHAATPQTTTQVQVVLGEAVLRRGAVAGAIRGTAIAVHRRRNTDPPAMAGQPAVGTP